MSVSTDHVAGKIREALQLLPADSYILTGTEMRALVDHLGGWSPLAEILSAAREKKSGASQPTWREQHDGYCHPRCFGHDAREDCVITDLYGGT